jgi:hypothetical protein
MVERGALGRHASLMDTTNFTLRERLKLPLDQRARERFVDQNTL